MLFHIRFKFKRFLVSFLNYWARFFKNFSPHYYIGKKAIIYKATIGKYVSIEKNCDVMGSTIGRYSYIGESSHVSKTRIGSFTSIGPRVIVAEGIHPVHFVSTSPATYRNEYLSFKKTLVDTTLFEGEHPSADKNGFVCSIGSDVWIASGVIIACGKKPISIGDGAVVYAGSVVTKDVPPFAMVAGVPAKIIGYRFDKETIKSLCDIKWWNQDSKRLANSDFANPENFIDEFENSER